ncbi:MAG: dTDP-4-dehydrorhamnose reductase [Epulopiscium sp. Nele67-Bin004]|nr:MAG: dTDP-4-dehydrorhamnose reductase [Epulopiscium sp. Nele67-Bin004]
MKIFITGSNGQLGLELQKQISIHSYDHEVVATDVHTLDISKLEQVEKMIEGYKPDVVINCAAYTAVDKCEDDTETAYKVNALGPRNLAIACDKVGAKLIHISTDYVFSGELRNTPWRESDTVAPQSVYGASKLLGEDFVRTFSKRHFILRTAWLYGEGNNFVRTMLKLASTQTELKVVDDQFGNPTSTKDLATVILNLMHTEYFGTYHATCEGVCSWYDFAKKIFELSGVDITVTKVTSDEFVRPAKRPAYSALDNMMLKCQGLNTFRPWEDALEDYIKEEKANNKI